MLLSDHPQVKFILESFRRYQNGALDVANLQENLASVVPMTEDIPLPVRDSIRLAESQLDMFRLTADSPLEAAEVRKIFSDVLAAVGKHGPLL